MWKNYLLTSYRTLKKEKLFVIINMLSLAMAFALCTIAFFNYQFNQTYNEYFEGHEKVYKLIGNRDAQANEKQTGIIPGQLLQSLVTSDRELQASRLIRKNLTVKVGDRLFKQSFGFADPAFTQIFNLKLGRENPVAMMTKNGIVLKSSTAEKIFGHAKVIGEQFQVIKPDGTKKTFVINAIIDDFPENTSLLFSGLINFDHYQDFYGMEDGDWQDWVDGIFIKSDKKDVQRIESLANSFLPIQNKENESLRVESYELLDLKSWPKVERDLYGSRFKSELHPASVLGTISSALAILLLACFNFFNASIAISGKRLKEVSMRKVVGGSKKDIIIQFMMECGLQVLVAFFLSLLVAYFLIGPYNAMFQFELVQWQPTYMLPYFTYSIGICFLVILLAGAYPAIFVSKFNALEILQQKLRLKGNNWIVKMLLTLQFAVCVYNIFSLGVFVENAQFQTELDRGYDVKRLINVPLGNADRYEVFQQRVSTMAAVDQSVGTADIIGFGGSDVNMVHDAIDYTVNRLNVGAGYLSQVGVEFNYGSDFRLNQSEFLHEIVINEMFATMIGGNAIGQTIQVGGQDYRVRGITNDFHLKPIMLKNKIEPTIFFLAPKKDYRYVVARVDESRALDTNKLIASTWYEEFPTELYSGFLQNKVLKAVNMTNDIMISINSFIALVSVFISVLGLYSLISLTTQRKLKEIGIRKTLGASYRHIFNILLKEIVVMMILAGVFGLIGAGFIINQLLDIIYAYHIEIDELNYLLPIILIGLITAVTVSYKVMAAAKVNPVTQLRTE